MKIVFGRCYWTIVGVLLIVGVMVFLSMTPESQREMGFSLLRAVIFSVIFGVVFLIPMVYFAEWLASKQPPPPRCPTCGQELPEEKQNVDEYKCV